MCSLKKFVELVGERYGNPDAVWLSGSLEKGQRVRIVLEDESRIVTARATGKRKNGKWLIRYKTDTGRTWILAVPKDRILTSW